MAKRYNRFMRVQKLPPHRGAVILTQRLPDISMPDLPPRSTRIRECRLIKAKPAR